MVLKCQEDSYIREWSSRVESCEEVEGGYGVRLSETIFFPEGGGQPSDEGTIDGQEVVRLERCGDSVLHVLKSPLAIGASAPLSIHWERRFDHMQQHSGQHLLSAVLEQNYKLDTSSWWLGVEECYVEVEGPPQAVGLCLAELEESCNTLIREGRTIHTTIRAATPHEEARLPIDQRGAPLRVVTISGLDDNPCCGTHVTNLSQLQIIKVLGVVAGKKGKTNIRFLVGGRVLQRLTLLLQREEALTRQLKGQASQHGQLIEKLQKAAKAGRGYLEEVAQLTAASVPSVGPVLLHRTRAPATYVPSLARSLGHQNRLLLLTAGDEEGPGGTLLMQGPKEHVAVLGEQVCNLLKGKGAFSAAGDRYQAKVGHMGSIAAAQKLVQDYFLSLSASELTIK